LDTPKDRRARPTLGRVREAVFSMLGETVDNARVLDLFAGVGGLGFEALSRGARACLFIDQSRRHARLIQHNARRLGCGDRVTTVQARLPRFLRTDPPQRAACDLVFVDPPYEEGLAPPTLLALAGHGWLAPGAVIVVETRRGESFEIPDGLALFRNKRYGDTEVSFLKA